MSGCLELGVPSALCFVGFNGISPLLHTAISDVSSINPLFSDVR